MKKKEVLYWFSVLLYGILLVGLLLYLRFPAEKFRKFCEHFIEEKIPGVSCTIEGTSYGFPFGMVLESIRLTDGKNNGQVFFEDSHLLIEPVWQDITKTFKVKSKAFGGNHKAKIHLNSDNSTIELSDMEIKQLDIANLPQVQQKLERKVTGILEANGSATISKGPFQLVSAKGRISISAGEFGLKKPILELTTLELQESSFKVDLNGKTIKISEGRVKNPKLNADFAGDVVLAKPWLAGTVSIAGKITTQEPLFQKNKQLKAIVARMQKRYKNSALPYKVGGTIGRPTFIFAR